MKLTLFAALLTIYIGNSLAMAQAPDSDWPQILGGNRNGVSSESEVIDWGSKPTVAWETEIGEGFSGPVIVNDDLILFHRPRGPRGTLVVQKFNASNGESIWRTKIKSRYSGKMDGDTGPKATPVVQEGFVYCHGPDGELACLNFDSGELVWETNARKMFNAPPGYFGCGSSPIVVAGKVLLNVGGKTEDNEGAAIVAFDASSGEVAWTAVKDTASYSSPIAVNRRQEDGCFSNANQVRRARRCDGRSPVLKLLWRPRSNGCRCHARRFRKPRSLPMPLTTSEPLSSIWQT